MSRLFQYAALLLLSGGAFGSVPHNIIPSHGHDIWDAAAGFPGGYVYSMSQTADGYIWIGTSKGLVRYGGWTFFSIPNSTLETKVPILNVLTDSNDELWTTDDHTHLFRYVGGRLVGPMSDNGRHRYLATLLNRTRDGRLLFASELQGVVEYDHGSARVLLDPSMVPRSLTAITQTADGVIWIGTQETGVFRLTLTQAGPEIEHVTALTSVRVNCLLAIGDSALLIGTDKGLLSLHSGILREASPELPGMEILALASGREGDVWIGSRGRVFKAWARDIDREGKIRALDRLSVQGAITALFEDRDGDLWIGGPEVIERYRASGFTTYLSSAGLPCSNCGAVYADKRDRIWFAPLDGGLFVLSKGSIRAVETASLKDDTVYSIAGGAGDEVWVARKNGGVTRLHLHGDTWQANTYTRQNGLAQDSVYSIYRAPDGTVWAGTLTAGLSLFRGETWHTFSSKDGLPSNTITAITGSTAGEIFAGTPNGLAVLKNGRCVAYTAQQGLPPGAIESLFFDDDAGTLWIGTTKGISFLRSGTVHVPLGAPDALYGEILGIAESQGWLWITTPDHVLRVKRTALLNQSFGEGEYREFGVTAGLPSTEGVKRSRTVVADHRGRIWFSLNKGISALEPSAFARPAFPVTIRLDGMLVDGRAVPADTLVHIPAGRHRVTFRYAGVNVSDTVGVRYRYRLDNVDQAWSEPTALREIDYTNIPPGQFQFHMMARNPDGVWSSQDTTIGFEVEPAYWQTTWFRVLCVAAFLGLLWALYQLRLHRLALQFNMRLEERVNERTRIARELHDTLLQNLHGLLFRFQAARNMLPKRTEEAMEALDGAITRTEQAIAESRDTIKDLRSQRVPTDLEELLTQTGRELETVAEANGNPPIFRVIVEGERQTLSPALQDEVYRIVRELLRNAFQHAGARHIEAEIRRDNHLLRVLIRDDGKGMAPKVLKEGGQPGHWGLPGVRERAKQIGAQLEFWSDAGAGTEVQLTVPVSVASDRPRDGSKFRLFRKTSKS